MELAHITVTLLFAGINLLSLMKGDKHTSHVTNDLATLQRGPISVTSLPTTFYTKSLKNSKFAA